MIEEFRLSKESQICPHDFFKLAPKKMKRAKDFEKNIEKKPLCCKNAAGKPSAE